MVSITSLSLEIVRDNGKWLNMNISNTNESIF